MGSIVTGNVIAVHILPELGHAKKWLIGQRSAAHNEECNLTGMSDRKQHGARAVTADGAHDLEQPTELVLRATLRTRRGTVIC